VCRAREAPVGHQRDGVAETFADERGGDVEHLAHPGTACRALVPDHDDVPRNDRVRRDCREALLLRVEHPRRTAMEATLVTDELHDRAFGRKVAAQHGEAAALLQGPVDGNDDLLAGRCGSGGGDLCERAAVDVQRGTVDEAAVDELPCDEGGTAGLVEVGSDEASTRLEIGDDRRARRDLVEIVELEWQIELTCDREQVEDGVGRAAGGGDRGDRVVDRRPREERGRAHVTANEIERELAGLFCRARLGRVERGNPVQSRWADA